MKNKLKVLEKKVLEAWENRAGKLKILEDEEIKWQLMQRDLPGFQTYQVEDLLLAEEDYNKSSRILVRNKSAYLKEWRRINGKKIMCKDHAVGI